MDKNDRFEEKKKYNAPFLKAFDFLAKEKKITDGQLAKMIGTNGSYISDLRNGKKRAGEELQRRLGVAFEGRLYMKYLTGESKIMLIENVSDEEIIENQRREENPDYDAIHSASSSLPQAFDFSLMIEHAVKAATAYADQTIATLRSQLSDKDKMLDDKEEIISNLKARIRDLELTIANNSLSDIEHYPFHIGAADGENEQQRINHI